MTVNAIMLTREQSLGFYLPVNPSQTSCRLRPHLGEDVSAVAVVTVRLAVVGVEARASQDGARGDAVFLRAAPLAVVARAACRQMPYLAQWGFEDNMKRNTVLPSTGLTSRPLTILCTPFCTTLLVGNTCGCGCRGISPLGRSPSYQHR